MRKSIAGTATDTIQSLNVSVLQAKILRNNSLFSKRKSCMDSTPDPDEIKRVKLHAVKCPKCKANLMIKPTEKVCPVCGGLLPKPGKRWQKTIFCARLNSSRVWIKGCNVHFDHYRSAVAYLITTKRPIFFSYLKSRQCLHVGKLLQISHHTHLHQDQAEFSSGLPFQYLEIPVLQEIMGLAD